MRDILRTEMRFILRQRTANVLSSIMVSDELKVTPVWTDKDGKEWTPLDILAGPSEVMDRFLVDLFGCEEVTRGKT